MTNCLPSPAEAATTLLRRRRARRRLLDFTTYTFPQYVADPAHALIADHLDAVVRGDVTRLMISAPPQHGKSELASVRLPAFWLARRPDDPVALASYGAFLAEKHSRTVREIVESADFVRLFSDGRDHPLTTNATSRAVNRWELAPPHRGFLWAGGVGGPITGHGFRLGVIDDPFENWEQAQSQTIRDKVWDWWRATFRTRIWEGGVIVIIMTRWHEDDLCGRLIVEQGDRWVQLRLPAMAETQAERDDGNRLLGLPAGLADPLGRQPGEPLCPRRYSREALEALRADVGSLAWWAEYQGVPRAPEGNRFRRAWFPIVDAPPVRARRVRYWDKAGTKDGGAYTAGVLIAIGEGGLIYVQDSVRGQWSAYEREQVIVQTAQLDAAQYANTVRIVVEQEPGSGGKESAEATIRRLMGFPVEADRPTGDKDVRLEPFAAQAEAGNVRLVRGDWNGAYVDELCAIPNGRYRDQADATAGAFNRLGGRRALSVSGSPIADYRG